ncbi:unnamed protein product [Phytophthora fragariaefolia]|uniref:Unnamed protein product n=1 Tax=Phytophthora fragariaefolia TaxID=1490495 RepID=A0A9W6XHF7_9STRA|nr:unnamed protein product [Phytophthora fragariaefolia]
MGPFLRDMLACEACDVQAGSASSAAHIATSVWRSVSMGFIFGFPRDAEGRTGVLAFVDHFSKMVHLAPVAAEVTADESAELFLGLVFRHHGLPESIVSDRDPRFPSAFWTRPFALQGTCLLKSTAAHPETDGQTESVNRVLEDVLRPTGASSWGPGSSRSATHASTGLTLFFVNNARHPRVPALLAVQSSNPPTVSTLRGGGRAPTSQSVQSSSDPPQSDKSYQETAAEVPAVEGHALDGAAYEELTSVDAAMPAEFTVANFTPKPTPTRIESAAVSELLLHRQAVTRFVRNVLQAAADQQKANADRRDRKDTLSFRRGDRVHLSTDGIQGSAGTNLGANKLEPRFIGPFKILKVIGDAYTLAFPTSMRLHPIFYVGRLKPYVPATIPAPEAERPQTALATSRRTRATETYYRSRWLGFPPAEDTSEPHERRMEYITDVVKEYEATLALIFDDGSLEHNQYLSSVIAQAYPRHESLGNGAAIVTDISDEVPAKSRGARRRDESDDDHTRGIDMDVSAAMSTATRVADLYGSDGASYPVTITKQQGNGLQEPSLSLVGGDASYPPRLLQRAAVAWLYA